MGRFVESQVSETAKPGAPGIVAQCPSGDIYLGAGGPYNFGCAIQSRPLRLSGVGTPPAMWDLQKFIRRGFDSGTDYAAQAPSRRKRYYTVRDLSFIACSYPEDELSTIGVSGQ